MQFEKIQQELSFSSSRSSGSGGQHVNKVETKVTVYFDIKNSLGLRPEEKTQLLEKLSNRINKDGVLILSHDRKRSQHKNKKALLAKLENILKKNLKKKKKRKTTRPPKKAIEARKKDKKHRSQIKEMRKKPKF